MKKPPNHTEPQAKATKNKAYLNELLSNIKDAYTTKESVTFKIVAYNKNGFNVKVGGLFAFVSFYHFGWVYPSTEFWQYGAKHFVGHFFRGKIYKLDMQPISIQIDANSEQFSTPYLKKYTTYKGVILKKSKYGFFVDVGLHFNWKCGSLLGLLHKAHLLNQADYDRYSVGEVISTLFQGFDEDKQLILGDNVEHTQWWNGDLVKLINTTQNATVLINKKNQPEFYVLGKYKALIFSKTTPKNYKNGAIIPCKILKINKRKYCFVIAV